MAKITRIKASDPGKSSEKAPKKAQKTASKAQKAKPVPKATAEKKPVKKPENKPKTVKTEKKPFILIRPIVYLGRYIRDSWREIRQVRWPSRKATWKLVLAIFVYTGIFIAIIMLLDALFTWVFGLLMG